jgi:carboxylate-amine ligase
MRMNGEVTRVRMSANAGPHELQRAFTSGRPSTVGLEEELMLLDPETLDLAPCAPRVLVRLAADDRFKAELPAAQLEIVGAPAATVADAAAELLTARRDLVDAAVGLAVPAGAGVHPFAAPDGVLSPGERYERIAEEFGAIARRQLVFGLHVHVAIGGPDRALAVYNALREHLPAIAALGAGSPFYEGCDTALASVRPKLCDLLPRQGIPPILSDWETYAAALSWGRPGGTFADARWWWEARLHPEHGTLEVRVADVQATVADTAALASVIHALVVTLADRHADGRLRPPVETWKIAENRWSACRHGTRGRWVDVRSGVATPMDGHLRGWLNELEPAADRLGCSAGLGAAHDLIGDPRAEQARRAGPHAHAAALAARFIEG